MSKAERIEYTFKKAEFNEKGDRRFVLIRQWESGKPFIMFIGLNPSTATGTDDDPTIRRVVRFAKDWGYGGVYMVNLFSKVTPNPKDLEGETSSSRFQNEIAIRKYGDKAWDGGVRLGKLQTGPGNG